MKQKIQKWEGWLEAVSPIFHGGDEKTGSTPVLRTIYIWTEQGEVPIPYISGNSIRGKLRRLLMKEFLQTVGVDVESMNTKLYHTFFAGGALEAVEETYATIDLEIRKKLRQYLIPLALFGTAIGNQLIPGKLKVGHAFPICQEYVRYLPLELSENKRAKQPVRIFTDSSFQTRRDDLRLQTDESEQAIQVKIDYECFIPGTQFYHWWLLEYATELETSCFGRLIEIFQEYPFIGGSSAIGEGRVIFHYEPQIPKPDKYLKFISSKRNEILQFIQELEKRL